LQEAFKHLELSGPEKFHQAEGAAGSVLFLHMFPEHTNSEVGRVVKAIKEFY